MKPLTTLQKRDLLASKKFHPEEIRAHGEEYFSQGRYGEAFEFYRKIGDQAGIGKVKKMAIENADPELLWRMEHTDTQTVSREDWALCGENAMRLGKHRSAAYVFQRIGDQERLAAAEKEMAAAEATAVAQTPQR